MMQMNSSTYAYETSWGKYISEGNSFDNRFLSLDDIDLQKICDCIDLTKKRKRFSGGIPIYYKDGKMYTLKEGPHTRVCGESGSKKSRTVCRGAVISAALNRDSMIITDPKGEIFQDPKIRWLLSETGHKIHVLDFRTFDKDGFNCLSYAFEMMQKGNTTRAMSSIDRFVSMLQESKKGGDDPFWNSQGGDSIRFSAQMLLMVLSKLESGSSGFNLASLKSFICQDKESILKKAAYLASCVPADALSSPFKNYLDILGNPDKTYACIVSSANHLMSDFTQSEDLLRMLSTQTMDIRSLYKTPTAVFMVIPDEVKAYDRIAGYLLDTFYQILIEEFTEQYQNKKDPPCSIHEICDEVASIYINDLGSKISASRSRSIDWILIYQSEKQMETVYEREYGTIIGNCKNQIFLGSSDYEILKEISDHVGRVKTSDDSDGIPLVSVDDLRRMRKEKDFKDALILTGNYILCAKLPDYDSFPFLSKCSSVEFPDNISANPPTLYTISNMYEDVTQGHVCLDTESVSDRETEVDKMLKEMKSAEAVKTDEEGLLDIETLLNDLFDEED